MITPPESLRTGARPNRTELERQHRRRRKIVVNHEEQYSIWPAEREKALGWRGKAGTRDECLEHIGKVWIDMRPLSLRGKES